MKEVAIVVLSWNAQPLLERYLSDLVQHTPLELADIILADNGSSDASVAYAKSLGVKVIELGENYGFARGYNEAIARLEHNYVLLLNNDVQYLQAGSNHSTTLWKPIKMWWQYSQR